ncbi:hypothetical protein [Stenotrophomonas sp.]|uniref:portal protein n=1 Tax=Stenotrophomonas sp. TaxID=69392 RepID=UPI0028A1921A|nr:hypothetical protein [Stenotrophomonas sp.]
MTDSDNQIGHAELLQQFRESDDTCRPARELSERDRDYYDGKQLSGEELEALKKRRQPPVISNRIAPKIDALIGHEKRIRTDPRAYPRTPKHEAESESATDAIRFVCDNNRFSQIRSSVAENLFIEGAGAAVVAVERKGERFEVKINPVPWDRFYWDPHSRKRDFSDAAYKGVVLWMDEADAIALAGPDADRSDVELIIQGCYSSTASSGDTFDDRPQFVWGDLKRRRVRVLQHRFKQDGEWWTAILCGGGFLRDPQVSPYVDEHGIPQCDLVATSAYIDRENNRYGVVRRMVSPQDEINKRRSKALHLLNSRQVIAEKGAVDNREQARREMARPDGYVEVNGSMRFDVADGLTLATGQLNLLQEAKAEIDASGVNPAIEGDASAPSGRAQEMMMASGLAEMAGVFEALRDWSWEVYRQVWYRIRQYWDEERWIRVTDDERNLRWVAVNRPVTQADLMIEQAQQAGQPLDPQQVAQIRADPMMQQVTVQNPLAQLDVDLILEDGPDSVNLQSEQYQSLIELKRADPAAIPTRAIIEASSLRNKDQILEHLDAGGIPPELQQQMQQMQEALQQAEQAVQESEQKAQQAAADNAIKVAELQLKQQELAIRQEELGIERFRAETERITAMRPQPEPQQTPPPSGVFAG